MLLAEMSLAPDRASGVLATVLVLTALLAACGGDTPRSAATTPTSTAAPVTTSPVTTSPVTTVEPAQPVLDRRVAFVIAALDDPSIATDDALAEQFAPSFLAAVPAADVRQVLVDTAALAAGPWSLVERADEGDSTVAVIEAPDGTRVTLSLVVGPGDQGRITAAQITPIDTAAFETAFTAPGTTAEIDAALEAIAARVVYGVYDVTDGTCAALDERSADVAAPTGSVFKLWVLAALGRAVERGDVDWDDTVAVDPALRSSPDGEVYPLADGTTVTVRRLAELMISISDNTATDHLIELVGRDVVEAAMADIGVTSLDRNVPFLTTRELFLLKFVDPTLGDRYLQLDADARREFLDTEVAAASLPWVDDPTWAGDGSLGTPQRIDDLEWFATPADVCRTLLDLDRLAATPGLEPVADILEINPGLPFPDGQWQTIRFKGGSEPGVVMFAYWLAAPTGERRVVVLSLSDPQSAFSELDAALPAARLLGRVAADPG